MKLDQGGIVLFDEESDYGWVEAASPLNKNISGFPYIPIKGNESVQEILRTLKPLASLNAQTDERLKSVQKLMEMRGVKSLLLAPLIVNGHVIGTLGLDSVVEHREFTEKEKDLCQLAANICATMIAHAQLREQAGNDAVWLERKRLRSSLHDTKGLLHAGVMMPIETASILLQRNNIKKTIASLDHIWKCARFIYTQLNLIMEDIADPVLAQEGLPAALERFALNFAPGQVQIQSGHIGRLNFEVEYGLYRIAQEAINNAVNHNKTQPMPCTVNVTLLEDNGQVILRVTDDGCGFHHIDKQKLSFGIQHMREAAKRINAEFMIDSLPKYQGVLVTAKVTAILKSE